MSFKNNPLLMTDGYKVAHHKMYAPGTTKVYSNFTCRSTKRMQPNAQDIVVFGTQYVFKYIQELWEENFFNQPKEQVCSEAKQYLSSYLSSEYDVSHFEALHDLGYLPIKVKSLEEGTIIKEGIPLFTIINTHNDFFWVTNFLETLISTLIWKPVHSASLALAYKRLLTKYALETDKDNIGFVDFQAHDFSFRGMQSPEAALASGLGFASVFKGSDTIPILKAITHFYNDDNSVFSVPATEHSVMCSGSKEGEINTFKRLLETFPTGILSVVSDTWDLWKVLTEYIPQLKEDILARDGKLVVRPDSGDPVDIICGLKDVKEDNEENAGFGGLYVWDKNRPGEYIPKYVSESEAKGVIELLWDTFGGTINEQGYKVLDSHIGAIYGDSITLERAEEICKRLKAKGFASTNIVFGVGSYSMGYATRDNQGGAVKSTYVEINDNGFEIFKDPITDDGTKKSAKGLLKVYSENGFIKLKDQITLEEENTGLLKTIFENGKLISENSLSKIREKINNNL